MVAEGVPLSRIERHTRDAVADRPADSAGADSSLQARRCLRNTAVGQCPGMSSDAAWAETDELRVAERSNPQIKSYVRPEEAAERKESRPCSAVTISVGT
jgi:hypothetical protein